MADEVTEWISLILVKCCQLGLVSSLMASAGGATVDKFTNDTNQAWNVVVPEQVVLLQCLASEMESLETNNNCTLLGGNSGEQAVIETHLFLARLYGLLRHANSMVTLVAPTSQNDPELALPCSAAISILELLASSLGLDSPFLTVTRIKLGNTVGCTLLQDAGRDLGALVDAISARNSGRKSREHYMSDEEKSAVMALVRLIGNSCFLCRQNQDLVRCTIVPAPVQDLSATNDSGNSQMVVEERNVLHIVLSCTSLAHSCFTLREWAVVAIRNLLDQNEHNQAEVAKLEANQPVQTAELGDLGIRVNMDAKGRVSVEPTTDQKAN